MSLTANVAVFKRHSRWRDICKKADRADKRNVGESTKLSFFNNIDEIEWTKDAFAAYNTLSEKISILNSWRESFRKENEFITTNNADFLEYKNKVSNNQKKSACGIVVDFHVHFKVMERYNNTKVLISFEENKQIWIEVVNYFNMQDIFLNTTFDVDSQIVREQRRDPLYHTYFAEYKKNGFKNGRKDKVSSIENNHKRKNDLQSNGKHYKRKSCILNVELSSDIKECNALLDNNYVALKNFCSGSVGNVENGHCSDENTSSCEDVNVESDNDIGCSGFSGTNVETYIEENGRFKLYHMHMYVYFLLLFKFFF